MREKETTYFGDRPIPSKEKKGLVDELFTSVANRYDLMNDLMSLGTHHFWKRFVVGKTRLREGDCAIDVCGGTADIAILMARLVGENGRVVVYDLNREMLDIGRRKGIDRGFLKGIEFVQGDAEEIAFPDNSFHAATVGFGIRNVTSIEKALKEMMRVVKPGGRVICLEFSHPTSRIFKQLYDLYSFKIIPEIGNAITKRREAYTYLTESIRRFPAQEELKEIMEEVGLHKVRYHNLINGVAAVHVGIKV
ncbi:MAG: bifunctional demethylmenaquinone methyltransferase/2-methoxy-6-polyprenyl-1,4-benzoquinol methylase UbiE [Thermodesulfobacteriota bacterium]